MLSVNSHQQLAGVPRRKLCGPPATGAAVFWRAVPSGAFPPKQVPEGATVLSNARELTTTTVDGQKVVEFEPTPVMSPYLLALVAGNLRQYGGAGAGVVGGVQYGFYAAPGLEWQLEMAAQVGWGW